MKTKIIHVVSMHEQMGSDIVKTLTQIFGNTIIVKGYAFFKDIDWDKNASLVIALGDSSYANALKAYKNSKVILPKKELSLPNNLDKLFLIEKDKDVIVINMTKKAALETISSLKEMKINHIKYHPYWPNCELDTSAIDTAISPGLIQFSPPHIVNKIDIGFRQLSVTSLLEILTSLNINLKYLTDYTFKYTMSLLHTFKKLSEEYNRAEVLKSNYQTIFDNIKEAIISIDDNLTTVEVNPAAETLLGIRSTEIIGKKIKTVFGNSFSLPDNVDNDNLSNIIEINGKQFFITYIPFNSYSRKGLVTFQETEDIYKMGQDLRRLLYKKHKGHIAKYTSNDIIAESKNIKTLIKKARLISQSDSSVLITGESGTGKELFSSSIHNASKRKTGPYVAVNFASIPDDLVESELFGYVEGAFTGATKKGKVGLFELANNGTIFLDEIGDASLKIQARLLRVLEEKEIMRVGDTQIIPINIRVIAATNKDLKELINKGRFREDLYYRLNIFPLHIPSLKERRDCIPKLIEEFMKKNSVRKTLSADALGCLLNYHWPGNIRELKNMVEYSTSVAKDNTITSDDLPADITNYCYKNEANEDEIETIAEKLLNYITKKELQFILEIVRNNKYSTEKIGRSKLVMLAADCDLNISAQKIRTIFKHLKGYGLISIGKTKQGTVITHKGEIVLHNILSYQP